MRYQPGVLEQFVQRMPRGVFDRLVSKHRADEDARGFDSRDHFMALLAASLGGHHGLRRTGHHPNRSSASSQAKHEPDPSGEGRP